MVKAHIDCKKIYIVQKKYKKYTLKEPKDINKKKPLLNYFEADFLFTQYISFLNKCHFPPPWHFSSWRKLCQFFVITEGAY